MRRRVVWIRDSEYFKMHKSEVLSIDYFLNSFVSLAHRIGRVRGSAVGGFSVDLV